MKKYIRTKDGCITEGNFEIGKTIATLYGDERITEENTADTIEELCDYVFLYDSHNELVIIDLKKTELWLLKSSLKDGLVRDIKLAILTDKGLIYVAKMNEQGDLELL